MPVAPHVTGPMLDGRHLGEGAFARVDLYQVTLEDAATPLRLAVKILKQELPGPYDHWSDVQPMIPTPPSWRANFQAVAVVSSRIS